MDPLPAQEIFIVLEIGKIKWIDKDLFPEKHFYS